MTKKYPKYSSKYYIRKEIEQVMNRLYIIIVDFDIYKQLKTEENKKYICDNFPWIFSHMLDALFLKVLIEVAKLFDDYDKKCISLPSIIEKYEKFSELYKERRYFYIKDLDTNKKVRFYLDPKKIGDCIDELKNNLSKHEKIIEYLTKRRNKSIAHNDKAFGFNKNKKYYKGIVTYEELEQFIHSIYGDVNQIYLCLFGAQYAYYDDHKSEITYLKEIIKNAKSIKTLN